MAPLVDRTFQTPIQERSPMFLRRSAPHKLAAGLFLAAVAFTPNFISAQNSTGNDQITTSVAVKPPAGHPDNSLSYGFSLVQVARGADALENPSGVITRFGYLNDFPPQKFEATKTEADENTYLVFDHNPGGPTPGYDYGRRFLFQGHENSGDMAYVTRINMDIQDHAHRITLMTQEGEDRDTNIKSIA